MLFSYAARPHTHPSSFQVLRLNVQEAVLSEAEARPAQDLKLLLDERSLGFVQRLALCPRRLFRADREHRLPPD